MVIKWIYTVHCKHIIIIVFIIIDVLVALQNANGNRCYSGVNEASGSLTVCAEILFINGTALTTFNSTVIISAYDRTNSIYSAQCKWVCMHDGPLDQYIIDWGTGQYSKDHCQSTTRTSAQVNSNAIILCDVHYEDGNHSHTINVNFGYYQGRQLLLIPGRNFMVPYILNDMQSH